VELGIAARRTGGSPPGLRTQPAGDHRLRQAPAERQPYVRVLRVSIPTYLSGWQEPALTASRTDGSAPRSPARSWPWEPYVRGLQVLRVLRGQRTFAICPPSLRRQAVNAYGP
jgi:hypothetical protein